MNTGDILKKFDVLLDECKLDDAEKFLSESIETCLSEKDYRSALVLYNEQIGYYRDCGMFEKSIESCKRAEKIVKLCGLENTVHHATTLLNIANAYRAVGEHEKSFETYERVKKIYDSDKNTDKLLYSSYYNNLSLLCQQTEEWEKSCDYLKKALETVEELNDLQKISISKTNLAVSLIRLNKVDEAEELLNSAFEYFCGQVPSDFHFSANLSALGDLMYCKKEYSKALDFYEYALAETELHMGKNNFYDLIKENIETVKTKIPKRENISGMELCRKFYEFFGKPMIHRNFAEYENKIVCGMVGEGSECFGFDDCYSKDHDFGASFCMWLDDDIYQKTGTELEKAYSLLPKTFMGITRVNSIQGGKRTGVFKTSEFYGNLLGKIPYSIQEWLEVPIEKLAVAVNGELFNSAENNFTQIRKHLINDFPQAVKIKHLAQNTALVSQYGQYNLSRMLKRNDRITALSCYTGFVQSALRCQILLENNYYPYYKWFFRSTQNSELKNILNNIPELENAVESTVNPVCRLLKSEIENRYGMETDSDYLENTAQILSALADELIEKEQLSYKIAELEFKAFDKVQNEGARANCQDDWETFSIMRVSQYLTWTVPMLRQYFSDFKTAFENGRNLITEKYARMMQSTAPEKYAELENKLPEIEADTLNICNAVCSIQVGFMEEFSEKFPKLSANARIIHTSEDTEYSTSYETYLRGELLTYSREMLGMYGQFIVSLCKSGKNLAYMTMQNTVRFYGYKSVEDAEKNSR